MGDDASIDSKTAEMRRQRRHDGFCADLSSRATICRCAWLATAPVYVRSMLESVDHVTSEGLSDSLFITFSHHLATWREHFNGVTIVLLCGSRQLPGFQGSLISIFRKR